MVVQVSGKSIYSSAPQIRLGLRSSLGFYQQVTKEDTGDKKMGNPYKAKTRRANPTPPQNLVPVGTVGELLKWVGDDKDRAQRVLDQENGEEKPRKSLTSQLEEIIDD